eukprot:TCONS_00054944-protein
MDAFFGERSISLSALTDFSKLDVSTKKHLKNVYGALSLSMLSASVGAGLHLYSGLNLGILALLGGIGFMLGLAFTPNESKNQMTRLGCLLGFAGCTGLSMGPLLDAVISINPSIVTTAFFATCVIFICFTLSALWAEERTYLYLGGTLLSGMSTLFFLGLINIFFGFQLLYQVHLYGGLLLFCGFILYDTQLIIAKHKNGDNDFLWHSVDLFLDFINIFRRIMIILANKENKKSKKKN